MGVISCLESLARLHAKDAGVSEVKSEKPILTARNETKHEENIVDRVNNAVRRSHAEQQRINAFISIRDDKALDAAEIILKETPIPSGSSATYRPLSGLLMARKDMFFRQREISTCGSSILSDFIPNETSTVLSRLDLGGAIDLGTLNMSEFALGPVGQNVHYGQCFNPHDPTRISGGSSSGSAASVAAGLVSAALGSDTAGSVRLPASMCGVVGIKTTLGRISRYGIMPLSESLDTVGVIADSVESCKKVFRIIDGPDAHDPSTSRNEWRRYGWMPSFNGLEGWTIGLPAVYYLEGMDSAVALAIDETIGQMRKAGASFVDVDLPDHEPIAEHVNLMLAVEAASLHQSWLRGRGQDYGRAVRERIETGLQTSAVDYLRICDERAQRVVGLTSHIYSHCDLLLSPVVDIPVPRVSDYDVSGGETAMKNVRRLNRKTRTINYLGLPAITMPAGRDRNNMPIGIQFIAPPFCEERLFSVAEFIERDNAG
ncbi:MAG: amidase [Azospirillaceae bacterium]